MIAAIPSATLLRVENRPILAVLVSWQGEREAGLGGGPIVVEARSDDLGQVEDGPVPVEAAAVAPNPPAGGGDIVGRRAA